MKYWFIFLALFAAAAFWALSRHSPPPPIKHEFPAGSPLFVISYDAAMVQARATARPAVIIFSAAWCPKCQEMKRGVDPSAEVAPFLDKFVWAYLDLDDPATEKAEHQFAVNLLPAIFVVSASGTELGKQIGDPDAAKFVAMLASCAGK